MNLNSQFLLPINFKKNASFLFQRAVILYMISGCVKFFNPWVPGAGFLQRKGYSDPQTKKKMPHVPHVISLLQFKYYISLESHSNISKSMGPGTLFCKIIGSMEPMEPILTQPLKIRGQ